MKGRKEMALFGSEQWVRDLTAEVNSNRELPSAGKGFNASIQFVVENAPGGKRFGFWAHMKDGRVTEASTGEKESPEYRLSGDYEVWKSIIEGEEDPIQAIMVKKLVFEGNLQVVMKYIKAVNMIMECVKKVPTEF